MLGKSRDLPFEGQGFWMPELKSSIDTANVLTPSDAQELIRLLGIVLRHDPTGGEIQSLLRNARIRPLTSEHQDRANLVEKARAVFNERKRRSHFFSRIMFGEPGWDVLLALYLTDFAGGRQTIGRVADWIGKPQTTTIRWIEYLEKEKLVVRSKNPRDSREIHLTLTPKAVQLLDSYFDSLSFGPTPA
jgi:DNA-binding MarR family transcriptional regulator